MKCLQEEINKLKEKIKSLKSERVDSKASLEEERSHRKSTIGRDDLGDRLNDLVIKVSFLEKQLASSKSFLGD